jgi:hypothetical protein
METMNWLQAYKHIYQQQPPAVLNRSFAQDLSKKRKFETKCANMTSLYPCWFSENKPTEEEGQFIIDMAIRYFVHTGITPKSLMVNCVLTVCQIKRNLPNFRLRFQVRERVEEELKICKDLAPKLAHSIETVKERIIKV